MFSIFDILDQILPSTDRSKHDILRLEYLSACKIMESDIITILPQIPAKMFDLLLQSVIFKCYLEYINIGNTSIQNVDDFHDYFNKREIAFPESLRTLILNWPHTELSLKKKIPPFHPPVDIFRNNYVPLVELNQSICQVEYMSNVFSVFCNKLVQFISQAMFKCTPRNTQGFTCNLRRLDLSISQENIRCISPQPEDILEAIRHSTIDTFGHKIEIIVGQADISDGLNFKLLSDIVKDNLRPTLGISVFFKKYKASNYDDPDFHVSSDFYKVLALGKCEYIQLENFDIDTSFAKNLFTHLPGLGGISLSYPSNNENLYFLSAFKYIDQLRLTCNTYTHNNLMKSISNMSKGLKCLDLCYCNLQSQDLECLANSIHSETLLELDLTGNEIEKDSEAVGLIMLCQKLKNVKVLTVDLCFLNSLSSKSVSKLTNALKECAELEVLSMRYNSLILENTNIIVDGLVQKKSLRYLSLDLPKKPSNANADDEDLEYQQNLCKKFHEKMNKFRQFPIYISWLLDVY